MSTLQQRFGMRLRLLRVTKGFTQEKLAELTELSPGMISNIERGINQPSFKNIERFSEVLEVVELELFRFEPVEQYRSEQPFRVRAPRTPSVLVVRRKKSSRARSNQKNKE